MAVAAAALASVLGTVLCLLAAQILAEVRGLRRDLAAQRETLASVSERVARLEVLRT